MYLGLDIGSSSSKVVLLGEAGEILAAQVVNLGTGTKGDVYKRQSLQCAVPGPGGRGLWQRTSFFLGGLTMRPHLPRIPFDGIIFLHDGIFPCRARKTSVD